jgi:RNA polymerase sigma-70 factor (ECF subfamily)
LTAEETDRVRAVLYLSGLRGDDLDDAAQEVQLRLLQRAAPDELRSRGAWACAVAVNLARDWHRRTVRDRAIHDRVARIAGTSVENPDVALSNAVAAGLARLDPDLRAVVILRFYADLPVGQIADLLQIPDGTVKSRLHRAVTVLRDLLPRESVT